MRAAAFSCPVEDGRLSPHRRIPRPPHPAVPSAEPFRRRLQPAHCLAGPAPVQQQNGVEELVDVGIGDRPLRRGQGRNDVQPVRPRVVVAAQPVDRPCGVRAPVEIAGPWPPGALPSLAEPVGEDDRLVPIASQRGDDDESGRGEVALLAMERQFGDPFRLPPGGPQVAGRHGTFGGHIQRVGELQRGLRRHRQTRHELGTYQRAFQRGEDLAMGEPEVDQVIQRGGLGQRIADAAGEFDGALGQPRGNWIEVVAGEGLCGEDPGFRGRVAGGEHPRPGEHGPNLVDRWRLGHEPLPGAG